MAGPLWKACPLSPTIGDNTKNPQNREAARRRITAVIYIYICFCLFFSVANLGVWSSSWLNTANYQTLGCWVGGGLYPLEGWHTSLVGNYKYRKDALEKCYHAALEYGYTIFGLQNGGYCVASGSGERTYKMKGASTKCMRDGEGGPSADQVSCNII